MSNAALIVAAGRGSRMMQDMPKQYLALGGRAVLWHTVQAFLASDRIHAVRVVIHPDDQALYDSAVAGTNDARLGAPVPGGASRADSVRLGLEALQGDAPEHVLIHDAARPGLSHGMIDSLVAALADADGVAPALAVSDALKTQAAGHLATVPRDGLYRVQTPQAFRLSVIRAA